MTLQSGHVGLRLVWSLRSSDPFINPHCVGAKACAEASTDKQWHSVGDLRRMSRTLSHCFDRRGHAGEFWRTCSISCGNVVRSCWHRSNAPFRLTKYLGDQHRIVCALVRALDRGGPALKGLAPEPRSDFLFRNNRRLSLIHSFRTGLPVLLITHFWRLQLQPHFRPPTHSHLQVRAKLLMMAESAISLATIALVASRAVGLFELSDFRATF